MGGIHQIVARLLYANWFAWTHSINWRSNTTAGEEVQFDLKLVKDSTGVPVANHSSIMMTDGKFVGLIVHVDTSSTSGPLRIICVRTPKINDAYDLADDIVLGTVNIPAGETGCFYSDPDTSDGTRSFFAYDNVTLRLVLDSGSGRVENLDLLLGMDMSSGALSGPYHLDGLHSPGF